ncbi:MAG: DUF86 domain-containing protein [Deltaproteobacteria bacterium]|nr:DUF86 domain-containing protein [Deltaproteobacteria bacterium]
MDRRACAQNALHVATQLAASAGLDAPDYTTAMDHLADLGVLDASIAPRFRPVAGLRNVLVHAYLEVDLSILHAVLNQRLDDFALFAAAVRGYVDAAPPEAV